MKIDEMRIRTRKDGGFMRTPKSVDKLPHQRPIRKNELGRDDAQQIAVEGLGFLAGDSQRLERFLTLSGLNPATLRAAAGAPGFLLAVLDHIAGEETLLIGFAAAAGHDPRDIARAREILGGPQPEHSA
jgi:hypothetical protein